MSGIYDSLASAVRRNTPAGIRKRGHRGPAPILQTLTKPILWDWPDPPMGSMNSAVYNFCDKVPANFKSQVYTPGGASFSRNYYSFLQSIQGTSSFPLTADLRSLLAINNPTPPIYPAPTGTIPKYWSIVNYDGSTNDVQRAYEVSEYPAKAWSTINIAVKDWYLGALVSVVKSNTNTYSTLDRRSIFGPSGLIPCRVASFIVALDPQPYVDIDAGIADVTTDIASIGSVSVGGLTFSLGGESENSLGAQFTTTGLRGNCKQILGATVASKNQAYIIAVQLERI